MKPGECIPALVLRSAASSSLRPFSSASGRAPATLRRVLAAICRRRNVVIDASSAWTSERAPSPRSQGELAISDSMALPRTSRRAGAATFTGSLVERRPATTAQRGPRLHRPSPRCELQDARRAESAGGSSSGAGLPPFMERERPPKAAGAAAAATTTAAAAARRPRRLLPPPPSRRRRPMAWVIFIEAPSARPAHARAGAARAHGDPDARGGRRAAPRRHRAAGARRGGRSSTTARRRCCRSRAWRTGGARRSPTTSR